MLVVFFFLSIIVTIRLFIHNKFDFFLGKVARSQINEALAVKIDVPSKLDEIPVSRSFLFVVVAE